MSTHTSTALVHAFCHGEMGGNPCFVTSTFGECEDLSEKCMEEALLRQCEVAHIHFSEVSSPARIRYFSIAGEKAFCGHGSLAAASWSAQSGMAQDSLLIQFKTGTLKLFIEDNGKYIGFVEEAGRLHEIPLTQTVLLTLHTALHMPDLLNDDVKLWIGGGQRTKAVIKFHQEQLISRIQINPQARDKLCHDLNVTGIYLYSETEPGRIRVRHFPLGSGASEDMATGNMAATMAAHLSPRKPTQLVIEQGGAACDISVIHVRPQGQQWFISGLCRLKS